MARGQCITRTAAHTQNGVRARVELSFQQCLLCGGELLQTSTLVPAAHSGACAFLKGQSVITACLPGGYMQM